MAYEVLWIVCIYALGAAAVHAANWRLTRAGNAASKHYVLHTMNDDRHIEWVVRSLVLFYWLQGRQVLITVMDEGSTDETLAITRLLARSHNLRVHPHGMEATESGADHISSNTSAKMNNLASTSTVQSDIIHITLRSKEDLKKLPISCPVR